MAHPPNGDDDGLRPEAVVPRPTAQMRARRHPWAILVMWGWQSALAALASLPAASLAGASYGRGPRGDAALWDAGGHALLDLLWHDAHALAAVSRAALLVLVLGVVLGLVALPALMFAMAHRTREGRAAGLARSVEAGLRSFRPFVYLFATLGLAQAALAGLGVGGATLIEGWTQSTLGEARTQQLEGLLGLVLLAGISALAVVQDLARAAVVRQRVGAFRALVLGARALRRAPLSTWWSWAWRALAGAALVGAGAALAGRLGGRGGAALAALAAAHQGVVVARIALRASWLALALRVVDSLDVSGPRAAAPAPEPV